MTMFSDLKSEIVKGVLIDRLKAYYYLHTMGEDRLRVSRVIHISIPYSIAVVPGYTTHIITNNSCFMNMLGNPRGKMNRLMKRYIDPVKVKHMSADTRVIAINP
jgi:hypothetical protein